MCFLRLFAHMRYSCRLPPSLFLPPSLPPSPLHGLSLTLRLSAVTTMAKGNKLWSIEGVCMVSVWRSIGSHGSGQPIEWVNFFPAHKTGDRLLGVCKCAHMVQAVALCMRAGVWGCAHVHMHMHVHISLCLCTHLCVCVTLMCSGGTGITICCAWSSYHEANGDI